MLFVEQKYIKSNTNETESKMKISDTFLERRTKNKELKVKLWWTKARNKKKKKECIIVTFILSDGNFFNICFISMHSVLNKHLEYI